MAAPRWIRRRGAGGSHATPSAEAALAALSVRPHWMERQLDPSSPAFAPVGAPPVLRNLTGRSWTAVGGAWSPWQAVVDGRGLVTPWPGGWSLDWWVGGDDRWHLPSREPAVRQSLVDGAPVVETAMRIPGGDAVHRVYALPGETGPATGDRSGDLLIVEVENRSSIPFAVGFAVRPYGGEGIVATHAVRVAGAAVEVDGRVGLLLPRPPAGAVGGSRLDGDAYERLVAARADRAALSEGDVDVRCPDGLAHATVVFPVPHRTTLRIAVPLDPDSSGWTFPVDAPDAAQAARGWVALTRRGLRVDVPDQRLQDAVDACRRHLLVAHDGPDATATPATSDSSRPAAVPVVVALERWGFHREAAATTRGWADDVVREATGEGLLATASAALVAAAAMGGARPGSGASDALDADDIRRLAVAVERAVHEATPPVADTSWARAALEAAGKVLLDAGDVRGSTQAVTAAADLGEMPGIALPAATSVLRRGLVLRHLDPPGHDEGDLDAVRDRLAHQRALLDGDAPSGLDPALTTAVAVLELDRGEPAALERLQWLVDAASPTWTWPTAIHPRTGGGSAGDGHDGAVTAGFLLLVRDLLVHDHPAGVDLLRLVPDDWLGRPIEVHDAPTRHGTLSFAVRWHGDRPALLWERTTADGSSATVTIRVPGLDPRWSTTDASGEALLGPVALPEGLLVPGPPGVEGDPPEAPVVVSPTTPTTPTAPVRQPSDPPGEVPPSGTIS